MEEIFKELEGKIILQEIHIKGLFNKFDYEISLENQEGVTILYGLNGIGKTTILKMIRSFKLLHWQEIFKTPFEEIIFVFHWFQESNKIFEYLVVFSNKNEKLISFLLNAEEQQQIMLKASNISEIEIILSLGLQKLNENSEQGLQSFNFEFDGTDDYNQGMVIMACGLFLFNCYYIESLRNNINKFEVFEEFYLKKKHEYTKIMEDLPNLVEEFEKLDIFNPMIHIDILEGLMNLFFDKKLDLISKHLKKLISPYKDSDENLIQLFEKTINDYLDFKSLKITEDEGIVIFLEDEKEKKLSLSNLSSGEKNLIVIFFEIIFRTDDYSLVMIDEPEISLNINWHYDFIDTLREIRKEKKIHYLIATHSPQIVNDYTNNCVDAKYKEK
ncbi:MAG: ATP-binding protein [Patescibacteria group bacterium]|nr:ATP-binding protein [Patescibacteria group bacterium]